ncbi:MAG TPA: cupin domain-containing protein [Chitinophagaceae bacterium]|nr:cupin domain-containing protein [Chitinophagaceae bacterium]
MKFSQAEDWIQFLHLQKHIEGGWYCEVYRSTELFTPTNRSVCTHIYFLLEARDFSTLHRIQSDELWHFYAGDPLIVYEFNKEGQLIEHLLGNDIDQCFLPGCVIQKGNWFGARTAPGGNYSLVGCTVSPGFDFADLELADAETLSKKYPAHQQLIQSLCRR